MMTQINITTVRSELYKIASTCIKYNEVISISTKEGNLVMMSEDDYRSIMESLALSGIKGLYESIVEGVNTPIEKTKKISWK
jgi:PHD/YefM family antitoxin component YafN of YafNO toxin-antitoxin module